jgi:uncharacterized membrane protein YbhN (UPF0104 family)
MKPAYLTKKQPALSLARSLLGLLISAFFLYLFLQNFRFDAFITNLTKLRYFNLIYILPTTLIFLYARALKWKILLDPLKAITLTPCFANIAIGLMGNNLLPARAGEIIRIASLAKTEKIPAPSIFSALVIERLSDGYTLIFFFIFGLYNVRLIDMSNMQDTLYHLAAILFAVYTLVLLTSILLSIFADSERLRQITPNKLTFLIEKLTQFKLGFQLIKDYKRFMLILFLTVIIWLTNAILTLVTLTLFLPIKPDIYTTIGLAESIFLIGAVSLGLAFPSAPGYFGTYHWIYSMLLIALGLSKDFSNSFVIINHGIQYLITTGIGLLFLAGQLLSSSRTVNWHRIS